MIVLPLLADEDFNHRVIKGLRHRQPALDLVRIQEVGLSGAADPVILAWAAEQGRILLTHDASTLLKHAYDRVRRGQPMPGVFVSSQYLSLSAAIESILLLAEGSFEGEHEGRVINLPLR